MWLDCIPFPQTRTWRPTDFKSSQSKLLEHLEGAGFEVEQFKVDGIWCWSIYGEGPGALEHFQAILVQYRTKIEEER